MFKQRVISGVILVIIALLTLIPGGYILGGVTFIIAEIAYNELMKAIKVKGALLYLGYIDIGLYYLVMLFAKEGIWLLMTIFFAIITYMGVYVFTFPKYTAKEVMMSFFSLSYGPMMLGFIYMTRELEYGQYFVWMIFISSWVSDTFAYLSGMLLGKHKLAPVLSPKKSIEGAIGGIIGAALVGGIFAFVLLESKVDNNISWVFVLIGAIGSIVSQVGDLAASAIKRNEEIKDYGTLIPGHGGIMDRFDSVIFTAPMIYLLSLLFLTLK